MKKFAILTILVSGLTTTSVFAGGEYQDAVKNLKFITNPSSSSDDAIKYSEQYNFNHNDLVAMNEDKPDNRFYNGHIKHKRH